MKQDELLYLAMWFARGEVLRHVDKESCISSTRILCDIYAQMGITSMPLTVDLVALNQVAFEKELRGESFDPSDPNEAGWGARCMVQEGGGDSDKWWSGHLLLVADGRYICDVSADQFRRPEHGILSKPSMFEFQGTADLERWMLGETESRAIIHLPNEGGILAYEAHPEELSYRESPDWEMSVPGDGLYDIVLEKVLGLVDLYRDAPRLPELPVLPEGKSGKEPMTEEKAKAMFKSLKELGYMPDDLPSPMRRSRRVRR